MLYISYCLGGLVLGMLYISYCLGWSGTRDVIYLLLFRTVDTEDVTDTEKTTDTVANFAISPSILKQK